MFNEFITMLCVFLRVALIGLFMGAFVAKKSKPIAHFGNIPNYKPRGANQQLYVKYLNDPSVKIVAGVGSAGTGKTLFACETAIRMLKNGDENIQKIVLTRPLVTVDEEDIGFLPGDISSKMNPWLLPIFDVFLEYYSQNEIDDKIREGVIEISPIGYMRGRTFKNCFIIADEVQNTTPRQLLMITTRIGVNSKLVLTGDLNQSDLTSDNGLNNLVTRLRENDTFDNIKMVEFSNFDIERSEVVKNVLKLLTE